MYSSQLFAQESDYPKLENDTLYFKNGFKVYEGQHILFGKGSTSTGDFVFIRRNSTGISTIMENTNNKSFNKSNLSLQSKESGRKGLVVKIVLRGNKRLGFNYQPLIAYQGLRYEVDIENAINSGEINVPEEFRPNSKNKESVIVINQDISLADELIKLKKLKDDGILTDEEFDIQKKKLLEKK